MMLRRRALLTSLLVAIPPTVGLGLLADSRRHADLEVALERVVRSQVNEQVRERCESDPQWFLTGPLDGRPKGGLFVPVTPDDLPPRPKVTNQTFELFAYDEEFVPSSSAAARFPPEFRRSLRASRDPVRATFDTPDGTGTQFAIGTGWTGSVCSYFLGRLAPPSYARRDRLYTYLSLFVAAFAVAWLGSAETVARIRKLVAALRQSADANYTTIAPDSHKDEISNVTFVYNDAANAIHQRNARIDDQDAALRRFLKSTEDEVSRPLADLQATIGSAVIGQRSALDALTAAQQQVHDLSAQVENLTAAGRLKMLGPSPETTSVDVNAVVTRVIARHMPAAATDNVTLHLVLPPSVVVIAADEALIERAVANVVDNAIRYNQAGGDVTVTLAHEADHRRFRLFVVDNGRGVSDEEFRGLTAVRRFRGDEGRQRRRGAPGLGLAVAREVCDRFGLVLDLKRPSAGGFEAEVSGPTR